MVVSTSPGILTENRSGTVISTRAKRGRPRSFELGGSKQDQAAETRRRRSPRLPSKSAIVKPTRRSPSSSSPSKSDYPQFGVRFPMWDVDDTVFSLDVLRGALKEGYEVVSLLSPFIFHCSKPHCRFAIVLHRKKARVEHLNFEHNHPPNLGSLERTRMEKRMRKLELTWKMRQAENAGEKVVVKKKHQEQLLGSDAIIPDSEEEFSLTSINSTPPSSVPSSSSRLSFPSRSHALAYAKSILQCTSAGGCPLNHYLKLVCRGYKVTGCKWRGRFDREVEGGTERWVRKEWGRKHGTECKNGGSR